MRSDRPIPNPAALTRFSIVLVERVRETGSVRWHYDSVVDRPANWPPLDTHPGVDVHVTFSPREEPGVHVLCTTAAGQIDTT